jgi:hypothetical protein
MFEHVQNISKCVQSNVLSKCFIKEKKNIQSDGCADNLVTLSSWRLSHFRLCSNVRTGKGHAGHASTMFQ